MKNLDYFTTFTRSRRVFFTRYGAKAANPVDGAKPANPVDGAKSAKSVCCDKPDNSFKLLTSITLQKIGPISTDFVDAEKASFFNAKRATKWNETFERDHWVAAIWESPVAISRPRERRLFAAPAPI